MNTFSLEASSPISPFEFALYAFFSTITLALFVTVVPTSDTFVYPFGTVFSTAVYVIIFPCESYLFNCFVIVHISGVVLSVSTPALNSQSIPFTVIITLVGLVL